MQLKISPDGYYLDGFNYFINTGITNQEYEYTGYFCEENDNNNKLSCYTRNDDVYNKDYYIEQLEFSRISDTINENEITDVLNDLDEIYSVVLNQDVRILISVKLYDNETLSFDSFKGVYYPLLISHILLSVAVIPIVLFTYLFAWQGDYEKHKKWTRFAWPPKSSQLQIKLLSMLTLSSLG